MLMLVRDAGSIEVECVRDGEKDVGHLGSGSVFMDCTRVYRD